MAWVTAVAQVLSLAWELPPAVRMSPLPQKEFYLRQTEDYSQGDNLSDNWEELLQRRIISNMVLCLVGTNQGYIPSKYKKKQVSMFTVS